VKRDDGALPLEHGEPLKRNRVGLICFDDDRMMKVMVKKMKKKKKQRCEGVVSD
jgi:hypothetical protein